MAITIKGGKMKAMELLVGVALVFLGIWPYLAKIKIFGDSLPLLGQPGSVLYQGILILIGLMIIAYANRRRVVFR